MIITNDSLLFAAIPKTGRHGRHPSVRDGIGKKNSSTWLAAFPMHQQRSILNLQPFCLETFRSRVTSNVLVSVTIGIGEVIQSSKAAARLVSFGSISLSLLKFCKLIQQAGNEQK